MEKKRQWHYSNIFILFLFLIFSLHFVNIYNDTYTKSADKTPKLSNSDIEIKSPQDRTYFPTIEGIYPATYGFENDTDGEKPIGWTFREGATNGYVKTVNEKVGHNKTIEIRKIGGTTNIYAKRTFQNTVSEGTVEFWMYKDTDNSYDGTQIVLFSDVGTAVVFSISNRDLYAYAWPNWEIKAYEIVEANRWYHVRIDFDLSLGWQVQIGDTWHGQGYSYNIQTAGSSKVTGIAFETYYSGDHPNYGVWIDAVALSWDPSINVGDNIYDGIPILFETSFSVSHSCYSLDGANNLTCVNETILYLTKPGKHTLRLYANDTSNIWYESELITFSIYAGGSTSLDILGDELYYWTILITILILSIIGILTDLIGGIIIIKSGNKKSERMAVS